jgi:hypothetical protein
MDFNRSMYINTNFNISFLHTTATINIDMNKHYVPYAALSRRKNILPEDGRILTAETCRRVYKCNCAVVGFIKKLHNCLQSLQQPSEYSPHGTLNTVSQKNDSVIRSNLR